MSVLTLLTFATLHSGKISILEMEAPTQGLAKGSDSLKHIPTYGRPWYFSGSQSLIFGRGEGFDLTQKFMCRSHWI